MSYYTGFQNRLKQAAKQMFGSQKALAEATGINEKQISNYISGINVPGKNILDKFQSVGISAEWLMTGVGSMSATEEFAPSDDLISNVLDLQKELNEKLDILLERKDGGGIAAGKLKKPRAEGEIEG